MREGGSDTKAVEEEGASQTARGQAHEKTEKLGRELRNKNRHGKGRGVQQAGGGGGGPVYIRRHRIELRGHLDTRRRKSGRS